MICPQCKCEYIRGVTQCSDCGIPLVDKLETEDASEEPRIVSVWEGSDPAEWERAKASLEDAGIEFLERDSKGVALFVPTGSKLEIWVSASDRDAARKIVLDEEGRIDADELTPEGIEALTLPESDQPDLEGPQDLSEEWDEDDPVSEIWNGDNEAFADNLILCLREIGIASRKSAEGDRWKVVVRPAQESRAKEIVREVVEASPPE